MRVPVRHGEGKFVTDNRPLMDEWEDKGQIAVRYVDPDSEYPSLSRNVLPPTPHPQTRVGGISLGYATQAGWCSA